MGKTKLIPEMGASGLFCMNESTSRLMTITIDNTNVIVTCTNTTKPLFNWDWVSPGCHINGVGSYSIGSKEVCSKFVKER